MLINAAELESYIVKINKVLYDDKLNHMEQKLILDVLNASFATKMQQQQAQDMMGNISLGSISSIFKKSKKVVEKDDEQD